MLKIRIPQYYRVKRGQTAQSIAEAFGVAVGLLVKENALTCEVQEGQIVKIPAMRGNRYTAQAGDSKALLCGSEENYFARNGTNVLYPEMRVIL